MSSASTFSSNFYGTPNDAVLKHGGLPRKFHMTTDASNTFWREEVAAAFSTATTLNIAGSTNSTQRVEFTTASKARVETTADWPVTPGAGTTFNVGGNTTVSPAAGSTFNVAGNTTALITTASKIQVETTAPQAITGSATVSPAAGTTFNVGGNTTALITTASKIQVETTAAQLITGSATVSPAAGTTFNIAGGTTVTPAAGTTFQTRPVATPQGEFTFETGATALSTFVSKVSSVAGTTELVSSGAGRVRVLAYAIQQQDSTVPQLVQFLSSGNALTGAPEWLLGQREGVVEPAVPGGYLFQTSTGEALQITFSTNVKTMVRATVIRTT